MDPSEKASLDQIILEEILNLSDLSNCLINVRSAISQFRAQNPTILSAHQKELDSWQ